MIILLGGSGYIGTAFRAALDARGLDFVSPSRRDVNYVDPPTLRGFLHEVRPTFLINAAGYTGKPNVDACEDDKANCLLGNAVLPGLIRDACDSTGTPWGHVSSGCIYTGTRPDGGGFTENDSPNFCFRANHCSFYSGTKALGEEVLLDCPTVYQWRLRIPYDHLDSPRNYLSKMMRYRRLVDSANSISHLPEFVDACLQLWDLRAPFGIYNITNPGVVTTREVTELLQKHLVPNQTFDFFDDEAEFLRTTARTPRSNCLLDTTKLQATGIQLTEVHESIEQSLAAWVPQPAASLASGALA